MPEQAEWRRLSFDSFPNVNELRSAELGELLDAMGTPVQRLGGVVRDPYVTVLDLTQPAASKG